MGITADFVFSIYYRTPGFRNNGLEKFAGKVSRVDGLEKFAGKVN